MRVNLGNNFANIFSDISSQFEVSVSATLNTALNSYINLSNMVKEGTRVSCRTADGVEHDITSWFTFQKCKIYEFSEKKKQFKKDKLK